MKKLILICFLFLKASFIQSAERAESKNNRIKQIQELIAILEELNDEYREEINRNKYPKYRASENSEQKNNETIKKNIEQIKKYQLEIKQLVESASKEKKE